MIDETSPKALVLEATITLESALATAEIVCHHKVVDSTSFNQMVELMQAACELLYKAMAAQDVSPPLVIFTSRAQAQAYIERHPPGPEVAYRIHANGAGRCTIDIYLLVRHL